METQPTDPDPIRFRPSKKRKVYRQRIDQDEDDTNHSQDVEPQQPPPRESRALASDFFDHNDNSDAAEDGKENEPSALAAAVRHRASRRGRLQGVGFRAQSSTNGNNTEQSLTLRHHQPSDIIDGAGGGGAPPSVAKRFTHQTGLISDADDKHMNEYIESRLSSRAAPSAPAPGLDSNNDDDDDDEYSTTTKKPVRGQPVMHGKLVEVDIMRAAAADKSSRQRQDGQQNRGTKRQRLGPDGKPWRSRNRRNSDDIKRDKLVEEFLHENRLDVYDVPEPSAPAPEADGEADERLAEEFRRQFLDDVARRRQQQQQRKKQKKTTQAAKPGADEVLKGPKLGGSRNQRAAVRDALLLKQEKETTKR